jgi:hypothetical protein
MDIIIISATCVIIFLLQSFAARSNAKMDTVTNQLGVSRYLNLPPQWFDPKVSWKNKHDAAQWRIYAKVYLPGWIYGLINKIKPAYDPLSDFWHYQKMKMIVFLLFSFVTGLAGVYLSHNYLSIIAFCVVWVSGWNGTFNLHLKSLVIK